MEDPDNALPRRLSKRAMRMTMNRPQRSTSVSAHRAQADTMLRLCHATTRLRRANVVGAVYRINTPKSVIDDTMATKIDTDQVPGAMTTDSQAVTAQDKDKMIATDRATVLEMKVGSAVAKGLVMKAVVRTIHR